MVPLAGPSTLGRGSKWLHRDADQPAKLGIEHADDRELPARIPGGLTTKYKPPARTTPALLGDPPRGSPGTTPRAYACAARPQMAASRTSAGVVESVQGRRWRFSPSRSASALRAASMTIDSAAERHGGGVPCGTGGRGGKQAVWAARSAAAVVSGADKEREIIPLGRPGGAALHTRLSRPNAR
jgi:hypothetical protein